MQTLASTYRPTAACADCGELVEHVTHPTGNYWQHLIPPARPHGAYVTTTARLVIAADISEMSNRAAAAARDRAEAVYGHDRPGGEAAYERARRRHERRMRALDRLARALERQWLDSMAGVR